MQLLSVCEDFNFWIRMSHAQCIPIVFCRQNNKKMTFMYKSTNAYQMKTATCIPYNLTQNTILNMSHLRTKVCKKYETFENNHFAVYLICTMKTV